ncbi:MAG: diacylglycerol/lipid kinase family protein, partial [Candidatus Kapaibacterium sp.]
MSTHIIAHARRRGCQELAAVSDGVGVQPTFTAYARHAEELAALLPDEASRVIVVGGDGTVSEVINGLMRRPQSNRPPICILPSGSGNDAARMLGLRRSAGDVLERLAQQRIVEWDVMKATLTGTSGQPVVRYGINVLSTGITAEVLNVYNRMMRGLPPDIGYAAAAVLAFTRYRAQPVDLETDGQATSASPLLVAVANCQWFGSGIGIAPQARPDDGLLNVTTAERIGPLGFLVILPQLR